MTLFKYILIGLGNYKFETESQVLSGWKRWASLTIIHNQSELIPHNILKIFSVCHDFRNSNIGLLVGLSPKDDP